MSFGKRSRDESILTDRNVCRRLDFNYQMRRSTSSILRAASRYTKTPSQPLSTISPNVTINNAYQSDNNSHTKLSCKHTRFYNKVFVVRIPSRYQYPEAMKQSIWASLKEISENARRNTIEFASEGWDWRKATEDDAMYVAPNGELVHPVHVRRRRQAMQRTTANNMVKI